MEQKPDFDYHEETHAEKLARKSKESPFMVVGLGGLAASVGYGIYSYKNRGQMSTSVFLMKFRVIAQGTAVGALSAGMLYTLYKNQFSKKEVIAPNVLTKNEHRTLLSSDENSCACAEYYPIGKTDCTRIC